MTDATRIGAGSCPVCASGKARFSLSKKSLVCVTCDSCNVQIFARSGRSDELLRDRIKAEPVQAATTPPEPPKPVRETVTEKAPAPPPATPPKPETRKSFLSWSST